MKPGWKKKRLSDVCQIKPPKKEVRDYLLDSDFVSFLPMEQLGYAANIIELKEDRPLKKVYGNYTYFADNDVLLAKITPCFENGKLGIARGLTNGVGFGSSEYIVFRSKGTLLPEYLLYFLSQDSFRHAGARSMTGAVGHKRVPKDFIENQIIPLPPLPEQQRIVSILDEVFQGIDKAIANTERNLVNSRELFESYLDGVFKQGLNCWRQAVLNDLCHNITVGHVGSMASKYVQSGIPFLRSQNIKPFEVSLDDVKYIDDEFHQSLKKSSLQPGNVAIVRTGYPGTAAVIPSSLIDANCSDLVIVKPKTCLNPHYLSLLLNSIYGKRLVSSRLVGAAQKHFNVTEAKKVIVPFPSESKQTEIIGNAQSVLAKVKQIEIIYQRKLKILSELKQSILKKTFTGELTAKYADKQMESAV